MSEPTPPTHGLRTPLEGTPAKVWDPLAPIEAPLCLHRPTVIQDWVDYNGHMSESCFLLVFGDSSDAFFRLIGIDEAYRDLGGHSFYTVQTMIHNIREAALGDPLHLTLQLLDADDRRLHLFHAMHHAQSGELLSTGEQLLTHVDMVRGRSSPMPNELHGKVHAIRAAHASLPRPAQAGATIGIRRTS
jgi:acyl-CoA thioester hydrolase